MKTKMLMTAIALGMLIQHADAQATNTARPRSGLGAAQFQCVTGGYSGGIEPFPIMFAPSGINTAEGIGPLTANFTSIVLQPGLYSVTWFYGPGWTTIALPPAFLSGSGLAPWVTVVPNSTNEFETPPANPETLAGLTQGGLVQVTSPNTVIEFEAASVANVGSCEVVITQLQ
jgi:hypothetical protein